jgi:hypothetical protein
MPYILDLKQEYLSYVARFERPVFELWGAGGVIAKSLYDSFLPFGVPLSNFQLSSALPNGAEPIVTIRLGDVGTSKFAYDRTESVFANFSEEFFTSIPRVLAASTNWLHAALPTFKVASHNFMWYSHSQLKPGQVAEYLNKLNPKRLTNGGVSLGSGSIFNFLVPSNQWRTQLMLDNSSVISDGLFVSLTINIKADKLDYDKIMLESRQYLGSLLQDLDLQLPELDRRII